MSENVTKFVHSIKVPRIYKSAAKIVKITIENGGSIKHLLYSTVKANLKGCYALVTKTVQNSTILDELISKTKLLEENPQFDVFLAKTLITELLFGKGSLQGESKPVQTILRYADILNKEFETYNSESTNINKSEKSKPRYVRVNTLKATCDEVIKELRYEGWQLVSFSGTYEQFIERIKSLQEDEFMKDMHIKDLLIFPPRTEFFRHYLYQDATLILQDKASCLPPLVLQLENTNTVLDMCAAPGMKTTMMSALMRNKGKIHAMEQNERRHSDLKKIVELSGCENVTTHLMDSLKIPNEETPWTKEIDVILLDPTCSCSGMTEEARHFSKPKDLEKVRRLAGYQKILLLHALTMFPSVRKVVYSTCSTLCEENEDVVAFALRKVSPIWSVVDSSPDWPSRGSNKYEFGPKCLTSRPEEDQTTGFFVALFERNDSSDKLGTEVKKKIVVRHSEAVSENNTTDDQPRKKKKNRRENEEISTVLYNTDLTNTSNIVKSEASDDTSLISDIKIERVDDENHGDHCQKKLKIGTEQENVIEDNTDGNLQKKKKKKKKDKTTVLYNTDTTVASNIVKSEPGIREDDIILISDIKSEKADEENQADHRPKKLKVGTDHIDQENLIEDNTDGNLQKKKKKKKKDKSTVPYNKDTTDASNVVKSEPGIIEDDIILISEIKTEKVDEENHVDHRQKKRKVGTDHLGQENLIEDNIDGNLLKKKKKKQKNDHEDTALYNTDSTDATNIVKSEPCIIDDKFLISNIKIEKVDDENESHIHRQKTLKVSADHLIHEILIKDNVENNLLKKNKRGKKNKGEQPGIIERIIKKESDNDVEVNEQPKKKKKKRSKHEEISDVICSIDQKDISEVIKAELYIVSGVENNESEPRLKKHKADAEDNIEGISTEKRKKRKKHKCKDDQPGIFEIVIKEEGDAVSTELILNTEIKIDNNDQEEIVRDKLSKSNKKCKVTIEEKGIVNFSKDYSNDNSPGKIKKN